MSVYVASSWRNSQQPSVVKTLRCAGYDVYDFKCPDESRGFHWSDIDPDWQKWTPGQFKDSLNHPIAREGFKSDWEAMLEAQACVLVLPCGRSAHLEAGYFVGAGKRLVILLSDGEPELMYKMADAVCTDMTQVVTALLAWWPSVRKADR
jgi:hypothetical protein